MGYFPFEILYFAQAAFTVWMLIDAYRRPADSFWFWVILLLQPVGAWAYFVVVKAKDFHGLNLNLGGWSLFQRRPSLDELYYRAQQTPTLVSHLELAQRLMERGEHMEAISYLESALAREPDHCLVLFALATCHVEEGRPAVAVPLLERITTHDRAWSNYSAWRLLVTARDECGERLGALVACRELARLAPTLEHRCLLAEHLLDEGLKEEAQSLLTQALEDHRYAPGSYRWRNRRWASLARQLQKEAYSRSGSRDGR